VVEGKLKFSTKFAFGVGQAGEGVFNSGLAFFLLFYYSQILELNPAFAGIAIGAALVLDGASDVIAGSLSDNWKSDQGRRHPFMYASFLPLSLCFFMLFFPLVSSQFGLAVWLLVFTNLSRTMLSLYHVPHLALGAEITEDVNDRSALVAYRQFFGNIGYLFGLVVFFWIVSPYFGGSETSGRFVQEAYVPWAFLVAVFLGATIFWSAWGTRSVIPGLKKITEKSRVSIVGVFIQLFRDFKDVIRSKNFRFLFSGVFVVYIMVGVTSALDLYMFTYFWELDERIIVPVLLAYAIGNALGTFVSVPLFAALGKKTCLIIGGLAYAFFQNVPVVLRLLDYFPENGDPLLVPALIFIKVIQGFATAQANVGYGSMMADVCDEHEYNTGRRQEGGFFAAVAFSAKATSGFGTVIAGFVLWIIEWPVGANIQSAADLDPQVLINMAIFYGPVVAALGFISVLFYFGYKLTPDMHKKMLEELAERRKVAQAK